ncbi:putative SpoVT/AbrB-like [Thiomonas sp. X19]|uniref:AbrB/MazE/SpoVT family DNA-binding domain-containing protein n=1 Tax=Thiomonas sp. X19 TaxID=1050370 RepID=UPI000B6F26DC|nr:AbrB/MazE/SpoVT family DNA-binding domain-containing protein [Thiomonas sp. X19]SCC95733.1 putative SpoVT/AbrB-like [Thiomonas sp. X19]
MELHIAKWGNSLALRLPAKLARELGVAEGSSLSTQELGQRLLALQEKDAQGVTQTRKALVDALRELHQRMPMTRPVSKDELSRY